MNKIQKKLLSIIQSDFPVTERPFLALARRAGLKEQEIIDSIRSLMERKIVRVFGPVFEPRKLGYISTLMAAEVDIERVAELASVMLEIREITHNYLRDNELNLWFTITARSEEIMEDIIERVGKFPGVAKVLNLPVVTVYKINAVFGAESKTGILTLNSDSKFQPLNKPEQKIVRALQEDFPLEERPYRVIAKAADTVESNVIDIINRWINDGTIRRFGARLDHRRIGYSANTLVLWKGGNIDSWGKEFAGLAKVSHCYRRKPHPEWPYELYTIIHAKSENEMNDILGKMKKTAHGAGTVSLKTISELKKTSMKYFHEE